MPSFDTVKTCQNSKFFFLFGLSSLAKNLLNEIASPKFQKFANGGLGEYPLKKMAKNLPFRQIQISRNCDFGT